MVMAGELVGWKKMVGMADYAGGAKIMLIIDYVQRTAGATVVRLTYGYIPRDEDDEYIKIAERAMDNFALATTPGMFMVDVFPLLQYIPWAPFKRTAFEWRKQLSELIDVPMAFVNDQMNRGVAEPSFVSEWLEEPGSRNDKSLIPLAAAGLYAGGADTTVSAISTFFVAILHYPEAQRLAQKEIDEVLGKDRLPTLAERDSLPYVEALYKEVLRWQPLGPIGIPHRLGSEIDDEYKGAAHSKEKIHPELTFMTGMRIPANSMVIANIWSMLRDPDVYQSPEMFEPSRYLGASPEPDPEEVAFGFGRRRCPGIDVARSSVWLSVALTLAAYNVTPFIEKDGKTTLPSLEYTNATIRHPKPFRCNITPRSENLRRMIEDMSL
ncbi:unnamed protein product [Rhizoctonia solani]|uniref:O-methylsterigmatocystin oxidoreductase n=1 Tax=Rhizoctonia solani TaxID=456999 RepID=A0A8H3GPL3_9AGAM|nr:unnamed protein product [Rhizoctonia solani]